MWQCTGLTIQEGPEPCQSHLVQLASIGKLPQTPHQYPPTLVVKVSFALSQMSLTTLSLEAIGV
jgi:hypothetical protein